MRPPDLPQLDRVTVALWRYILPRVLHSNPQWTLDAFFGLAGADPHLDEALALVSVRDLVDQVRALHRRRAIAERTLGAEFDALVLVVLREAAPRMVDAAYLRKYLGGPRWKLSNSLARLADQGRIRRTGETSGRRYGALMQETA